MPPEGGALTSTRPEDGIRREVMKDIVRKIDRAKEILTKPGKPSEAEMNELGGFALDILGEVLANSRRIAVALEKIAEGSAHV